jgi:hypothetical protein
MELPQSTVDVVGQVTRGEEAVGGAAKVEGEIISDGKLAVGSMPNSACPLGDPPYQINSSKHRLECMIGLTLRVGDREAEWHKGSSIVAPAVGLIFRGHALASMYN